MQKREARITANVLLSLIERMKANASPLPMRFTLFEASVYHTLGLIALSEGTEESTRMSVTHFQTSLEVHEAIGSIDGIATAKNSIAIAKSKYACGNKNEEFLKKLQEFTNCVLLKLV